VRGPEFNGIVIDVGCMSYGAEESIITLIDRFNPRLLLGFDANEELQPGVETIDETVVIRIQAAAWFMDGPLPWRSGTLGAAVNFGDEETISVRGVNLGYMLDMLPEGCVLKMDAEGAEYILLPLFREMGLDRKLHLAWIEWHPPETANGFFNGEQTKLRCPMEVWDPHG